MKISEKLVEKAKEAFMLAIEVYNKPSIKYRVEGFSFFICNAWELMLKSHMIDTFGEDSVFHKNNPSRTISLSETIRKVFTNNKDPLRRNLEKIVELRDTSTHFITEEYEMIYIPLFQACVFNFIEKMEQFHHVYMSEIVPQNFLTLSVSLTGINVDEIRAKYPENLANRLININDDLAPVIDENNDSFAIRVDHRYYITKDKNSATATVAIEKNSATRVKIVKELKDPNDTHKYTMKKVLGEINKRLEKQGVILKHSGETSKFTSYDFKLFCEYYGIKENLSLCYVYKLHSQPNYSYLYK